jgi:hypothetical protein
MLHHFPQFLFLIRSLRNNFHHMTSYGGLFRRAIFVFSIQLRFLFLPLCLQDLLAELIGFQTLASAHVVEVRDVLVEGSGC